jgi:hypothetical protein
MSVLRETLSLNINTTHWIPGTNRYRLPFAKPLNLKGRNATVALYQYGVYNSSYNISTRLQNNTFTIKWRGVDYQCVIDDGYYSISDLNIVLQYHLTKNKLYCINTTNTSQVIYNFSLSVNNSRYAVQLDCNYIPASTSTFWNTYSLPSGATWTKPSAHTYPQLVFSTNLEKLLGFNTAIDTYPLTTTVGTESSRSFLSVTYPILSPVFSYLLTCNLISNKLSQVQNLFHQIAIDKPFGQLLAGTLPISTGLTCDDALTNYIEITFLDQDYNSLQMVDPEITLTILLMMDVK